MRGCRILITKGEDLNCREQAFDFSNSEFLFWSQITDKDEEQSLSKFHSLGGRNVEIWQKYVTRSTGEITVFPVMEFSYHPNFLSEKDAKSHDLVDNQVGRCETGSVNPSHYQKTWGEHLH